MAEGKRPGGLTALAVLNFVFGGLGALGLLALIALLAVADKVTEGAVSAAPGAGTVYVAIAFSVLSIALMIISGVGYILQKKLIGRMFGSGYAGLSILSTIFSLAVLKSGFGLGTIIGLVYPVLTLYLLNVTFKDDLVN